MHARMLIAAVVVATAPVIAAAAGDGSLRPRVRSGGVGEEERQALAADTRYNLKVVTAMRGGQYLTDVDVKIVDQRGSEVVAARMAGPWLLAEIPPGRYRVVADYRGTIVTRDVAIGPGARSEVVLQWPDER